MIKENAVLMREAREALAGKWGFAIGTYFLYMLIVVAINIFPGIGGLASFLVGGALSVGLATLSLSFARGSKAAVSQLFVGFNQFGRSLFAYFLVALFTLLWMLLLIIPGIIAALAYSQVFYILVDDESISARDALKKSKKMMYGYKWKYFCLGFRFLGWGILTILTLGIGLLWLIPYIHVSSAKFYDDIVGKPISPKIA